MRFKEWLVGESVVFKRNVKRDADSVLNSLRVNTKRFAGTGASEHQILAVIRHDFTTYNDNIRLLDRQKGVMDPQDWLAAWNKMTRETHRLVAAFIEHYLPEWHQLLRANDLWLSSHLKPVAEPEPDDDPRNYRSGFRGHSAIKSR